MPAPKSTSTLSKAEAVALENQKLALIPQLTQHYETLTLLAPGLAPADLVSKAPHHDPIILPSSYSAERRAVFGLQNLAAVEAKLCVAQAHDLLELLRQALGLRAFLTRQSAKVVGGGIPPLTRAQSAIQRAGEEVFVLRKAYEKAWAAIESLGVPVVARYGLQPLLEGDLTLLSTWLENESYRHGRSSAVKLPWIWTIGPLALGQGDDPDAVSETIQKWNQEGKSYIMYVTVFANAPVFYLFGSDPTGLAPCSSCIPALE